jgi:hypothetical protein
MVPAERHNISALCIGNVASIVEHRLRHRMPQGTAI